MRYGSTAPVGVRIVLPLFSWLLMPSGSSERGIDEAVFGAIVQHHPGVASGDLDLEEHDAAEQLDETGARRSLR